MITLLCLTLAASPIAAPVVIQAVGDLNLSGEADEPTRNKGYDFAFDGTRDLLSQGDVNIANLETPITNRGTAEDKRFTFRMRPASAAAIAKAGITLVSEANNHTLDYGPDGLKDTLAALDKAGITHAGAGMNLAQSRALAVVTVKGTKVGLLSYSLTFPETFWATPTHAGTAHGEKTWIEADVKAARPQVDVLLVSFHWGQELMTEPKPYQVDLGRAAIDAGADAVIGTHPHVLQGIELYRGKPILYSLGNYAFGSRSHKAANSALVRLELTAGKLTRLEAIPLDVDNTRVGFDPQVAPGARAQKILVELAGLSEKLGTHTHMEGERLELGAETASATTSPGGSSGTP